MIIKFTMTERREALLVATGDGDTVVAYCLHSLQDRLQYVDGVWMTAETRQQLAYLNVLERPFPADPTAETFLGKLVHITKLEDL